MNDEGSTGNLLNQQGRTRMPRIVGNLSLIQTVRDDELGIGWISKGERGYHALCYSFPWEVQHFQ